MGQEDILKLLEKKQEPLSAREISEILNQNPFKICNIISKMISFKEIHFIEISKEVALEKYNCKRRMRLYYVKK